MKLLIKLSKYIAITLFIALGIFLHDFLKQQLKPNVQAAIGTLDIVSTTNTQDAIGTRFLDKADNSYFIDPASTGNSLIVAGNVGIGTTTPASSDKVTITQSSTAANTTGLWVTGTGANTTGTSYGTYVSKDAGAGGTAVAGYFQAQGGTNNYGLIVGAGNVGIGSTAPTSALDVTGTINATTFGTSVAKVTAQCNYPCTATATCAAGKNVIYGMSATAVKTCDSNPSTCTAFCTPGSSSCAATSTATGASVVVYCGKTN